MTILTRRTALKLGAAGFMLTIASQLALGQDGPLNVDHFKWSGDNSELGRRVAGRALLKRMRALEAKQEPYIVVGHSHGGSVLSASLLSSDMGKLYVVLARGINRLR